MASPVAGGSGQVISLKYQGGAAPLQFSCIKLGTAAMTCDTATAKTDKILGIVQELPMSIQTSTNWFAPVALSGVSYAVASAAIAIGDTLIPTTAGKMATGTRTTWSGTFVMTIGVAMSASASDLDIFTVLIRPQENGY